MNKKQKALLAFSMTTSVALLAGCAGGNGAATGEADFSAEVTGTLNAWGFENADDVGTSRLDYAEKQLEGVEIDIDATAFDAQKFTTRAASGEVPDVVQMDRQYVATYAAQDLIIPVDECFAEYDVDPSTQYYQSVVDDVTYDDKIWGVPQFYQPPAIILNKRVMDAAGVTPEEIDTSKPDVLLAAAKKMYTETGGNPAVLGFDPVAVNQAGLWMLGYGGQLVDEEGKPALDDEDNVAAVTFLKELMDAQGGYAKVRSFTDSFDIFGDENPYTIDQVAASINPQWYVNVLTPYIEPQGDIKAAEIAAVPFRNQDGEPFTVASGTSFVIPNGAKNPAAACAWMINLTSQDAWLAAGEARAKTIAEKPGAVNTGLFTGSPAADEAIREQFVDQSGNAGFDQTIATYYEIVGEGESFGASPAGQEIQTELKNAMTSALLGDKTPEEALADAQTAAMRAYDQAAG